MLEPEGAGGERVCCCAPGRELHVCALCGSSPAAYGFSGCHAWCWCRRCHLLTATSQEGHVLLTLGYSEQALGQSLPGTRGSFVVRVWTRLAPNWFGTGWSSLWSVMDILMFPRLVSILSHFGASPSARWGLRGQATTYSHTAPASPRQSCRWKSGFQLPLQLCYRQTYWQRLLYRAHAGLGREHCGDLGSRFCRWRLRFTWTSDLRQLDTAQAPFQLFVLGQRVRNLPEAPGVVN